MTDICASTVRFQSTHPVRGGTIVAAELIRRFDISIHPPREGWDHKYGWISQNYPISIHPPREGWDARYLVSFSIRRRFQSTHPVRGGTIDVKRFLCYTYHFNPPTP